MRSWRYRGGERTQVGANVTRQARASSHGSDAPARHHRRRPRSGAGGFAKLPAPAESARLAQPDQRAGMEALWARFGDDVAWANAHSAIALASPCQMALRHPIARLTGRPSHTRRATSARTP